MKEGPQCYWSLLTIASSFPTRCIAGEKSGSPPRLACRAIWCFEPSAYTLQGDFHCGFRIKPFVLCNIYNILVVSKHVLHVPAIPLHTLAIRIGHMLGAWVTRYGFFGCCWVRHSLIYIVQKIVVYDKGDISPFWTPSKKISKTRFVSLT